MPELCDKKLIFGSDIDNLQELKGNYQLLSGILLHSIYLILALKLVHN